MESIRRGAIEVVLLAVLMGCGGGAGRDEPCSLTGDGEIEITAIEGASGVDSYLAVGLYTCSRGARITYPLDKSVYAYDGYGGDAEMIGMQASVNDGDHDVGAKTPAYGLPEPGQFSLSIWTDANRRYSTSETSTGTFTVINSGSARGEAFSGEFADVYLSGSCSGAGCDPEPIIVSGRFRGTFAE